MSIKLTKYNRLLTIKNSLDKKRQETDMQKQTNKTFIKRLLNAD